MFTDFVVQPIFNLLVLVYALIPGHNFGLSLIIFTIIVRLLMWPLVKRQLRQTKVMRQLQPELKRIKKEANGNRQKESMMMMELYKERGVNPLGTIPVLIVQLVILFGLFSGINRVIHDSSNIVSFAYPALQHLSWLEHLRSSIGDFDNTLFGIVDLSKSAFGPHGTYVPALLLVFGSAVIQFLTSRQLMPTDKNARKLRDILKEAGSTGKQADQTEVNAAVGRSTQYIIPFMVFLFTVNLPAALSLYWVTGGVVAFIQQYIVLREDEADMEKLADAPTKDVSKIAEAEVVSENIAPKPTKPKVKKQGKKQSGKRRKK